MALAVLLDMLPLMEAEVEVEVTALLEVPLLQVEEMVAMLERVRRQLQTLAVEVEVQALVVLPLREAMVQQAK